MMHHEDQTDTSTVSGDGQTVRRFALWETWMSESGTRYQVVAFTASGKAVLLRERVFGRQRKIILEKPPEKWRQL